MTAWLSGWLRDIVLIILLASFVDLLIPNNSLERYVKVVISLIILLTILSPVISFLDAENAVHQALRRTAGNNEQSQALSLILSESEKLKKDNDRSSTLLTEQEIGRRMKESLGKSFSMQFEEVVVTISENNEAAPSIQNVHVVVGTDKKPDSESRTSSTSTNQKIDIDQVPSLSVDVKVDSIRKPSPEEAVTQVSSDPARRANEDKIKNLLKEQWGISEDIIGVEWR